MTVSSFVICSFFPDTTQPFINVISNTVFSFLVKIKVCKKPQRKYDVGAPTTITVSLPGTDPQDAERRRQVLPFVELCELSVVTKLYRFQYVFLLQTIGT